jgi:DNA-binding transcriptional LysR family regulator
VAKRVYSLERGLFASPELMARYPEFAGPEDLNALPLLAGGEDTAWAFTGPEGTVNVEVRNPPLRSGNAEVRLQAAMAGLGVARITATFCARAVAQGRLVRLLPQWECAPLRIYALLPGRRLVPAKVRAFLDGLEEEAAQQGNTSAPA